LSGFQLTPSALHYARPVIAVSGAAAPRVVLACSALRRSYRDTLRHAIPATVLFLLLDVDVQTLRGASGVRGCTECLCSLWAVEADAHRCCALPACAASAARLEARAHAATHFMPAALLVSQLATLERADDLISVRITADEDADAAARLALQALQPALAR
jgi:gluconate kinase